MKKRIFKIVTTVFAVTVLISLFAVPALADDIEFKASLSFTSRRLHYIGDEVDFTVKIVNTDILMVDEIRIYNINGRTAIATQGSMNPGEIAYIPVTKVFSTAGKFDVKFKVTGIRDGERESIETNTVTVTINDPPTPTPTQQPSRQPTAEPIPTQTLETQLPVVEPSNAHTFEEPASTRVAVLEADGKEEPFEISDEQGAGGEQGETSNTILYVIIAVLGAVILAGVAGITIVIRKMKKNKN